MKKFKYRIVIALLIALQINGQAQQNSITIYGKIISADDKSPVAGATISIKGNRQKVTSTNEGSFSIVLLSISDTLIVSHVSYQLKQVILDASVNISPLEIELEKVAKQLDEIIVNTGFQQIPKERATGSFDFIDNKILNLQTGTSILDRLNGTASSVLFDDIKLLSDNKKLNFNIRGLSTINGTQDPLLIIDNFPYEGDINNINPNDIESVTILKDAAAASIWGTRAGNGVIIITTKKGKFSQPLRIELNTNIIVSTKPDLFYLPQMNSADYIDVEQLLYQQGAFSSLINSSSQTALSPALEIFVRRANGQLSVADSTSQINALKGKDVRNDYNRYMYRKAITKTYSLSLRGGSDKIAYLISAGYDKSSGLLNEKNNRINVHIENIYKPIKNLQATVGILYTNVRSESGKPAYNGNGFSIGTRSVPYISFADASGNSLPVALDYRNDYTDTVGGGKLLNWKYYPLNDYKHNTTINKLQSLLSNIALQYQISKALSLDVHYQYEKQLSASKNLADMESYETRNLINNFTQIDPSSGTVKHIVPLGSILKRFNSSVEAHNVRGQISFAKIWNEHTINAITGAELRQTKTVNDGNTIYGYNDDLLTSGNVDFANEYPTYVTGSTAFIPNGIYLSEKLNRFVSLFGNVSYSYKGRYTISGSFRKDASNLFGVNINDKWKPFWSVGTAWDISKEAFYKLEALPYLKLRTTYGFSGNVDQTKSAVTILTYVGTNEYTNFPIAQVTQYANSKLKWEEVSTFNIGLDFASRKQVVSGSIEFYQKKGINLFGPSPYDYTAGLNSNVIVKNVANMSGNGLDISLQIKNIDKQIKWFSNILFNYNVSKTTDYYASPNEKFRAGFGMGISPVVGKPLYAIASYKWGGLDPVTGDPRGYLNKQLSTDYNAIFNSLTSPDSLIYSGPSTPKFFGAIGNTINWKGFSLWINITYKLGYYFRKSSIDYDLLFNSGIGHSDYAKRWKRPGDELVTDIPSLRYPNFSGRDQFYLLSEATVLKGDHIRLQFINCSYDFKDLLPKKTGIKALQLYMNVSNIGILWKANDSNIDPDYPYAIPSSKTYAVGVRATF